MASTAEQYMWFHHVAQQAYECQRCSRMASHSAVLGPLNGRIESRVLFVGEAPGRFGSATTRIPFHGDRSGDNFERLLPLAGLIRDEVFITNAVMCNPTDEKGRNDRPTAHELRNCSEYLRELLDIVQPPHVVTLGQKALDALGLLERHSVSLSRDAATGIPWRGTLLVPMYHPSARVVAVRGFERMSAEYRELGRILADAADACSPSINESVARTPHA
ncbi:MAG: hypothetical protein HW397_9 [Dehalococcoidia bacterium]|nr:hypothetical protein [Dehalococcoidia bacterium]